MKIFIGLALCVSISAQAATVFETQVRDENNKTANRTQQVWLSDTVARVNNNDKMYSLLLLDNSQKSYFVDINKKQVMDLSEPPPMPKMPKNAQPAKPPIKAVLKKHGAGDKIAGYDTVEYHIYANDKLCGSEFVSIEVLNLPHVNAFLTTMKQRSNLRHKQQEHLPFMSQNLCQKARQQVADELVSKGAVLRSLDDKGKVQFEMHKISLNQTPSAGYFELPKDFKVMTLQQMMQKMMQKAFKAKQPAPSATMPAPK